MGKTSRRRAEDEMGIQNKINQNLKYELCRNNKIYKRKTS